MSAAVVLVAALTLAQNEAPGAQLTKLPELLQFVEAPYPPDALAERRESAVILALDVDATGIVQRVEVIESGGAAFDEAAMAAAAGFVFRPAEAGELGAVPVRITYRYAFVLRPLEVQSATIARARTSTSAAAPVNFHGKVREAGSRAPVAFATVEVSASGTVTSTETDRRGQFAFRGVSAGPCVARVRASFFEPFTAEETLAEGESLEVVYFVPRSSKDPYEIIVRAEAPRKEVARRTLRLEEITRIPGTQGDALRVLQNMPGVARAPFGLGLLVVRGAPPQDTGVFLDGHRVPLLFHFGGIGGVTSVIHSNVLDEINFLPGGFGPEYGLVSAGAVELKTREPRTDRVHGEAQIDTIGPIPVTASVFLEGPAGDDPEDGGFVFSLRRSSIDGVFALISLLADSSVAFAPRFYDYQLRYERPLGTDGKRTLGVFAYGSDDELILTGAGDLGPSAGAGDSTQSRTFFHRINPRYVYRTEEGTTFRVSPIVGFDSAQTDVPSSGGGSSFKLEATNWHLGLLLDGEHRLTDWLGFSAGGDVLFFMFSSESAVPAFAPVRSFPTPIADAAPIRVDDVTIPTTAASLFTELEIEPLPGLVFWPGLRLQLLHYTAEEQPLVDQRLVDGRALVAVDPRLTMRYRAHERLSLKGQAGLYRQPSLPFQIFLNADLPYQKVQQYSAGVEVGLVDRLTLDLQGFFRFGEDVARQTSSTEVVNGKIRPVGFLPDGEMRSYGMELLLRLESRWDLFGWIAYTLSRSESRREDDEWEQNFFFDQTHNLNVVAVYQLGLDWHLGTRFRYVTGGTLPKTSERWYDADFDGYQRDIDGQTRAPAFHQLDVYVEKRWAFDQWYLVGYLDVQNVYNHTNTEFYLPTFDFKSSVAIPGLPILPALGFKGVF